MAVLREGHPLGNHPGDGGRVGGWMERWGRQKMGIFFKEDERREEDKTVEKKPLKMQL